MTHLPALIRAVLNTYGPVLEFGAGYFSTPILVEMCKVSHRQLTTVEQEEGWAKVAQKYHPDVLWMPYVDARAILQCDPPKDDKGRTLLGRRWAVVLIDHAEDDRPIDIAAFAPHTEIMVVHDTTNDWKQTHFPIHWMDRREDPHTSILAHREIDWTHGWERIS